MLRGARESGSAGAPALRRSSDIRCYSAFMTSGDTSRLIETLKAEAGEDKRLACADAFMIARDLEVPFTEICRTCDELGIKVIQCQLGCF